MKLKELNEGIASTCKVRPNVVSSIQNETFKQLRAALDKGEKVIIPGFGQFAVREVPAMGDKPAKKAVKFKLKSGEEKTKKEGKEKRGRKAKGEKKPEAASTEEDDE